MYAALNADSELIFARDTCTDSRYYCPQCTQAVYLKKSSKGKFHFAHYRRCDKKMAGETIVRSSTSEGTTDG